MVDVANMFGDPYRVNQRLKVSAPRLAQEGVGQEV